MSNIRWIYVVLNEIDVIDTMIIESLNEHDTYRKSLDGTKAILKFDIAQPNTMSGHIKLTHAQVLQYLSTNTVDWNPLDTI